MPRHATPERGGIRLSDARAGVSRGANDAHPISEVVPRDREPFVPSAGAPIVADRYELLYPIARTARSVVHAALDLESARRVAIKQSEASVDALEPTTVECGHRECAWIARLSHPAIPRRHGCFELAGKHHLVMDLVAGDPWRGRPDLRWDIDTVLVGALQLLDALAHVHRAGLVHRDVKPGNVLIDLDDGATRVSLVDFDIALGAGRRGGPDETRTILGTISFMAPEQTRGEALDGRADVHAVGVLVHHLLTGAAPFGGAGDVGGVIERIRTTPLSSVHAARPEIPAEVDGLIARATAKSPDARYADAAAMMRDVRHVLAALPANEASDGSPNTSTRLALRSRPAPRSRRVPL